MSMPGIPDINPLISLTRKEVIHMILASIALEELGLSNILHAEGEKIQRFVNDEDVCLQDILQLNRSVERVLRGVVNNQILLQHKLEDVLLLDGDSSSYHGPDSGPNGRSCPKKGGGHHSCSKTDHWECRGDSECNEE
ncbi:hypothetical protein NST83_08300 [Paenibacillus sp. FSL R10-2782]|uniref:hypothetical protein n=1 Tax=Paenibacillus sp. FSL R10-2782 TaxID=2954661 RepID=UPI003157F7B8